MEIIFYFSFAILLVPIVIAKRHRVNRFKAANKNTYLLRTFLDTFFNFGKFVFTIFLILLSTLFYAKPLKAQTSTSWINPEGGDWNTASNWSNGVPVSNSNAVINLNGNYTITINNTVSIGSLSFGTTGHGIQTLSINNNLTLQNGGVWTSGTLQGSDSLINSGTFTIKGNYSTNLKTIIKNIGTINLNGTITFSGGSLINESNGKLNLSDSASIENYNGGPLINYGLLLKTGKTGTASIFSNFINYDSVIVNSGNLLFAGGNTVALHGGTYNVLPGDSLFFTDDHILVNGTLTGDPQGIIIFDGKNNYADSTVANLNFGGTGVFWTYGYFTKTGNGSWSNKGKFNIIGNKLKYISNASFYNHGSIEITGNPTLNGGSLINESDGTVTMLDSALLNNYNGKPFTNYGHLIIKGGSNTIKIYCPFVNYNDVMINSGNLFLRGTITLHSGTYSIPQNDTLYFAADHLYADGNLTGNLPGTVIFEKGNFYADSANAVLNFSNTGIYWTSGYFSRLGLGTWTNNDTLTITGTDQKSLMGLGLQFLNHGVININSGFVINSVVFFINESDGIININNNAGIGGNGPNPGPFDNYGLVEKTGTGQSYIGARFLNETGGSITGTGALRFWDFNRNWGNISPGTPAGKLTLVGNFKMDSAACILDENIGGNPTGNNYGQLVVNGNASLNGNLEVRLLNGFVPQDGDVYTIMKANNISGNFNTMSGLVSGSSALYPNITNNTITLTAVKGIPALKGPISVQPNSVQNGSIRDVAITGSSFPPDVEVYLLCDQCNYPSNSFKVPGKIIKISKDSIYAQFDFSDQFISGQYELVVKDPRGESAKTLFNVNAISYQNLTVNVYPVWPFAKENPTQSAVVAFSISRPLYTDLIVNYALSGSAKEFQDYVVNADGPIKILAGETERDLIITPLKENFTDPGDKTVTVTLLPSANYQIDKGESEGTVTITDGPPAGTFALFNSTPDTAGNDGTITLTINGEGFFPNSNAVLQGPKTLDPISLSVDTLGNFIEATFNLTGLSPGDKFDLVVNNGQGKTGTIPDALTIQKFKRPDIYVGLSGPNSFRFWQPPQLYYVSLSNRGNVDAYMVPLFITVSEANTFGILKPYFKIVNVNPDKFDSSNTGFPGWGNKSAVEYDSKTNKWFLSVVIPEVKANSIVTLSFYARGHTIDAWTTPTGQPLLTTNDMASINPSMETANVKNKVHVWSYFSTPYKIATTGLQFLNCISALFKLGLHAVNLKGAERCMSAIIWYALRTGVSLTSAYSGSSQFPKVWSMYSVSGGFVATSISCIEGLLEEIPWVNYITIPMDIMSASTACWPIVSDIYKHSVHSDEINSMDPNYIAGPSGIGDLHYTKGIGTAGYMIHFENDSTATAPAKFVNVTDQLDPDKFDISTFNLGPITFGDTTVIPPPNVKNWITTVRLPNENKYVVRIIAGINEATDIANWQLMAIDTSTEEYPSDPTVGFLPPNVYPPEGEGSVFFTIKPNGYQASGSELDNKASVIFDANAPIYTNKWSNVLDFEPPVSHMNPLSAVQSDSTFRISWEGYDATSGIAGYNIYVSTNHGPFSLWVSTTDTTALYLGSPDSVYGFYSIAEDYAGNVEQKPDTAEVTTSPIVSNVNNENIPKQYSLSQNFPNPFNPSTTIRFGLPKPGYTTIRVFNILGQLVSTLFDSRLRAGRYSIRLDASRWASGVYFYRVRSGNFSQVKKMLLLK